jgi:hypothetical protein
MRGQLLLSFFLLLIGTRFSCYWPNYTGPYVCDPRQGGTDCPDGWSCINNLCMAPGTQTPDLGPPDASPPDTSPPDIAPEGGCTHQGMLLVMAYGRQLWACQGNFPAGAYASLCDTAAGYHVCGADPHDDYLLMLLDCDSVSGFYLAQINLSVMENQGNMSYSGQCDAPPGAGQLAILGCGTGMEINHLTGGDCHSLNDFLSCPESPDWSCSPQRGLNDVAYTATMNHPGGVLCCSN